MQLWVKICGIRTFDALEAAIEAGADAVGLVLAASPREVMPAHARKLVEHTRDRVETVLVMRHPAPAFARGLCQRLQPDWLQTDAVDFDDIRLPDAVRALPVYRDEAPSPAQPRRIVFEGRDSGTGEVCDWRLAQVVARTCDVVLAGGLGPDNVADAIAAVRPFGVDVSSGVERARGEKDIEKIHQFVTAAREAAAEL